MSIESPRAASTWRSVAVQLAHWIEPEGDPADVIYGTLIAAAVIATEAHGGESGLAVVVAAVGVLVIYWFAHVYSDILGERLHRQVAPGWRRIVRTAVSDLSMLRGSFGPVVVFVVVDVAGASISTAGLSAVWATVGLLGCWGGIAAVRGGARGWELAGETVVCALLGFAVVALRVFFH